MKYSTLANQNAMVTVICLMIGSLVSIIGKLSIWPIGIYSLILSILIFLIEYPRSGKHDNSQKRQSIRLRPYQHILGDLYSKLGFFYSNYFYRFITYLVLCIPCLFTVATIIPAFNLIITSLLYLMSNYRKEKWIYVEKKAENYKSTTVINPPDRPPPRDLNDLD